ncbi:MAG: Ig-like domain repeat protein [Lachnospiraceae bacterium]|nr:Ig-like domain repeat protein [Lachnospiraceae bacterium]
MEKLWNNSSKLYKVIAIVLTLIMVVTPLYIHFNKRYDAKAAAPISLCAVYQYDDGGVPTWAILEDEIAKSDNSVQYGIWVDDFSDGITKIYYTTNGSDEQYLDISSTTQNVIEVAAEADTSNYKVTKYDDGEGIHILDEAIPFPKLIRDNNPILGLSVAATVNGTDFAGNVINCKSGDVLEITITTGYDLTGLNIFGTNVTDLPDTYEGGNYDTDYVRTYRYTYTFSGSSNEVYTNKDIIAYDTKNPSGVTISCSSLIYDINKPVITEDITPPATGYTSGETYTNYTYKYKITSGVDDISQESELEEAYYVISGAKEVTDNGRVDLNVPSGAKEFTGNIPVPVSKTNSGTTIEFHAKDKAGNENTKSIKIIIDDTPPTNPEVKYLRGGDEISAHSGTYYLKPDDTIKITTSDNFNLKEFKIYDGTTYNENDVLWNNDNINDTLEEYSARLYELYNKATAADLSDGSYNLGIRAYDWAKNGPNYSYSDSPASFTIDGTDPQQDGDVELWYMETGILHQVTSDMLDSGNVFCYNSQKYGGLEYRVKIDETNFNANTDIYLKSSNNSDSITGFYSDGGYYNHSIPVANATLQPVGEAVEYTIYVVDYAGNDLTITGLPKICVVDTDIRFSDLSLKDSDGHSIATDEESLASISQYSNKVYTLSVTVKSGFELSTISLKYDDTYTKTLTEGTDFNDSTEEYTNLYYAEVEFKIPAEELGELANKRFNGMQLYAEDTSGEHMSVDIPLRMYDSTKPIVRKTDETKITTDTIWHQSVNLSFAILSGTEGENESPLDTAGYTISGSNDNDSKTYTPSGPKITDTVSIPESNSINGTVIRFNATDKATNIMSGMTDDPISFTFKVDATKPVINSLTAAGNAANALPLSGDPEIAMNISDNLTLDTAEFSITLPDGTVKVYSCSGVTGEQQNISVVKSYTLSRILGSNPADGQYKIKLTVNDKAHNPASKEITFVLDNTLPVFTADIVSGTSGKNNGFYNTAVKVKLTVKDANFNADKISVTDNGSEVALDGDWTLDNDVYTATVTVDKDAEGSHNIKISGSDNAGVEGVSKNVSFTVDKTIPEVSLSVNGSTYTEDMGVKLFTDTVVVKAYVSDTNEDLEDLRIKVTKTVPGQQAVTYEYTATSEREFTYTDEADYTINFIAVDKANNQSDVRTVRFKIDKTLPVFDASIISGTSSKNNGYYNTAVKVKLTVNEENFSADNIIVTDNGTEITVDDGWSKEDGVYAATVTVADTAEGIHNIKISGVDIAGLEGVSKKISFTIDKTVPEVELTVNGSIYLENMGVQYESGTVTVKAAVKDTNEDSEDLRIQVIKTVPGQKTTSTEYISTAFREFTYTDEADYTINFIAVDKAGNSSVVRTARFNIDNTAPALEADIVNGTSVKNNGFYNSAVQVRLSVKEDNFNADEMVVTDNGSEIALDGGWTLKDGIRTATVTIPETSEGTHNIRISGVDKAGVKGVSNDASFTIDKTIPEVELSLDENPYNESMGVQYRHGNVVIRASVKDTNEDAGDLRVQVIKTVPGQETTISEYYPTSDREFIYTDEAEYAINFVAVDKANNQSVVRTVRFIIDTTAPELDINLIAGTSGKQNNCYNSDVVVRLTCVDNNLNPDSLFVTDNNYPINVNWTADGSSYYADVTFSSEGEHTVVVSASDKSGTSGAAKQIQFIIDKTAPTVALLLNGGTIYNESMGTLNLTGPANINISVTDNNDDLEDLRVQVIKTVPDSETITTEYMPTSNRLLSFSDEADYVINLYAVDRANNQSVIRTISFRIDTTAPTLTISGADGGTSSNAVSVGFNITESFWQDATGTVTIYRKAGDGQEEALYKTLTITPNQRVFTLSELLSDTGVYRFEFEARDRVGHTTKTEQSITVDRNKPEIKLTGVNNYDVTDGFVNVSVTVSDEFFSSKTVSATGTVIRPDGTKNAVRFSPFLASGNPTTIEQTFSEDGIYDITILSRDIAGNESSYSVHFTIDTTAPVIKDLSEFDGKTFNSIDLDLDLDEFVSDLTVCNVRMYLNGSEYDGVSDIEDGSYTLLITAEDELGHKSEQSATFVLDTKAPVFIVTGVEDGDVKEENYDIEISLQLDEDMLTSVKLNDKDVLLSNNNKTATLKVTDRGVYELYMAAVDPAGNEAEQTISFVYGDEEMAEAAAEADSVIKTEGKSARWWLWIIAAAAILGGGGFIFILLKRRKSE